MKKIVSLILTLALLVGTLAVLPVYAAATTSLVATEVTLGDGVLLNFYIEANGETSVTNAEPVTKNGKECYKITVSVAAKKMNDDVTVKLSGNSGAVGGEFTASVKDAVAEMFSGTDSTATKELITALLNYGAAAQRYFGYNTGDLVGTPVTDTSALKAASTPKVTITDDADIFLGATLVLEGTLKLRFYFEGNDRQVEIGGSTAEITNCDDRCYADVAITPDNITERFNVRCDNTFVKYSALNYLKNKVDDASLSEMVASIYAYSKATEKYLVARDCTHANLENEAIQYPSLYNRGMRSGTCTVCGDIVSEVFNKTSPDINKYNKTKSGGASYSDKINVANDILGTGKHFYPHSENGDAGRDLYVEFSLLYNETLANSSIGYLDLFRFENDDEANGHTLFYLSLKDNAEGQWCSYKGGFSTGNRADGGIFLGPDMPNAAEDESVTPASYVTIGDYGWHRIGLKLHQEASLNRGSVVYTVKATLYIDGVAVSGYYADLDEGSYNNLLFTATLGSNNKLSYKDMETSKNFYFYKLTSLSADDTFYIITADEYARAADSFALNVSPDATPEADTLRTNEGVTLDARAHFDVATTISDADIPAANGNTSGNRVLLVSIDGLRPDTLANSKYYEELRSLGSYTMNAQTINPSITMPAHMSMFHSVTAATHNMTSNLYKPSPSLKDGITEALYAEGLTAAMFLDWEKIQCLTKEYNGTERYFIPGRPTETGEEWYERSTVDLCNAVLDHVNNTPTDFTFLYFALGDSMGHDYMWLSDKYTWGVDHILENLIELIKSLPEDYTVIVTADHGGGGEDAYQHGSANVADMTIPLFIIGEGYEAGKVLNFDVSILDVTPTIADILDVEKKAYWEGNSLVNSIRAEKMTRRNLSDSEASAAALEIFLSRDSWGNYAKHGKIKSFEAKTKSLKIGATSNGRTAFAGFQLNKEAISEWVSLGYKYLSFTVMLSADSGAAPKYVDTYVYPYHDEFFVSEPFITDPDSPCEQYYAHGGKITLDLEALLACTTNGSGLNFILIKDGIWTASGEAYSTFAGIRFSKTL